jgi:hypothetical protein
VIHREDDIAALKLLLEHAATLEEDPPWLEAFTRMLEDLECGKWSQLTEKQRGWVGGIIEQVFDEPAYLNLFSSGKVPRGLREVPDPPALAHRPLKPPGRR